MKEHETTEDSKSKTQEQAKKPGLGLGLSAGLLPRSALEPRLGAIGNISSPQSNSIFTTTTAEKLNSLSKDLEQLEIKLASTVKGSNSIRTLIAETTETLNTKIVQHQKSLDETLELARQKIDSELEEISNAKSSIEGILGAISTKSITHGHHTRAEAEERSANQMRWGGIACMALSSAIMIWLIIEMSHSNSGLTGSEIAARIAISLILSIPAAYLTRESAKHRQQHYRHRAAALDLATIDPFLASMPEDKRNELKLEIARRLFAQTETPAQSDPYPINVQEILMALVQRANTETPKETKKDGK